MKELLTVAARLGPPAAVKAGLQVGGECLGARTMAGLQGANHPAVGGKVKEEMHMAPGRENGKLKAMKRLPSWNQKLEESYQSKEMEYGSAGS